ncbi:GtrA family protein [Aridibaculum aurantiacum]|uniref:GtrA family protein n=1 Tax=Aridibaculum aurantiacum TaxID=2810307 RepID=UPI001A969ADE|nr:GtrA family protein [Aridibaculum aurantiacum]
MRGLLLNVIDFFYPPFRSIMPLQTFRYAACGSFNTVLDITLYVISINFWFTEPVVHLGPIALKPHIAAFLAAFCVSFPVGFYFSRYLVFTESNLRGRIQLVRYFVLVLACIGLNYIFIKFFVEQMQLLPVLAKILTTVIVVTFSYLSQKHFTFKVKTIKLHHLEKPDL